MLDRLREHISAIKHGGDGVAGIVTLGALFDMLPRATAAFSLVYVLIRIYETATIQSAVRRLLRR